MARIVIWALRWDDVDPARHAFDPERARRVIEAALAERPRAPRQAREDTVDRALLASFEPWIAGWRWAASEPGGGGPVRAYCCADHSLEGASAKQAATVAAAVSDWRARLEDLARVFADLRAEERPIEDAAPRAAARLLPLVLEWTAAEDAWYGTFERVLAWALEAQGVHWQEAETWARAAISGRFSSWVGPEDAERDAMLASLRDAARAPRARATEDATARWLAIRARAAWKCDRSFRPGPVREDGHERFIAEVDAARDPVRAHRMRQTLARVRKEAKSGKRLDLERLSTWQRVVLGEAAPFREHDAFAHEGRERYGHAPDLRERFEACLADANDDCTPVISRAARVYLDVCFVHPFTDGNARAARLALDFVLTQAGLALHAAGPVFLLARRVVDVYEVFGLERTLDYLAGERPRGRGR